MSLPQFYLRKRQRLKLKIYTFHPQVAQGSTVVMLAHVTPHSLSAFLCQDFYTEIFIHPFSVTDIDLSPANAGILSWTQVWQYQYHDSLRCIAAYSDAKVLTERHFKPLAAVGRDPTRIIKSNTNFCDPFHPITFVFFFLYLLTICPQKLEYQIKIITLHYEIKPSFCLLLLSNSLLMKNKSSLRFLATVTVPISFTDLQWRCCFSAETYSGLACVNSSRKRSHLSLSESKPFLWQAVPLQKTF